MACTRKDDTMAATQKKTTNSTRKATGASGARASSGSRSGGSRAKAPEPKPIRREVGAVVCFLLALFTLLGLFNVKAIVIDVLCGSAKGLIGYGYWFLPFALAGAGMILLFHRGHPVRLRVTCTLLLPVTMGSLFHLFLTKGAFTWSLEGFKAIFASGEAMASGGAVAGVLGQGLIAAFSKFGAAPLLILAILAQLMAAFRLTPVQVVDWLRDRPHPKYEEKELPARPVKQRRLEEPVRGREPKAEEKNKESVRESVSILHRRKAIDIPVDDPLGEDYELEEEPEPEERRSFFERKAKVPTPDQLLGGEKPVAEPAPSWEDDVPVAPPDPFPIRKEEFLEQVAEPVPAPVAVPPQPPIEITREPAVSKLKKEEADQVAAQVSAEVEEALAQETEEYNYPPVSLLREGKDTDTAGVANELKMNQARLTETIHSFGIDANIVSVTRGPSVTRYELELDQGVRLNKLTNLSDDLALSLGASGVRIAPIPDKISMVGIEVPNKLVTPVAIHDVIGSDQFQGHDSKVAFALGKDIGGNCIVGNIAKLPHLLIAGTTGSGKSVCTNSLIISLLYKASPEEVRLIMVDPKMVELGIYNGIPHLLIPVVTDPKKAAGALQWAVVEMMKRYRAFSEVGVRDLASYNAHAEKKKDEGMTKMPQIVVVIDELADLMLVAAKEVEESICRVAQMGRAAGMHLIVATQRPSADVITGLMKANIPSRIAFAVASSLESRIILDNTGAETLVGRGDMLYLPLGAGKPTRVQGCLITDEEVASVVEFIKENGSAHYDEEVLHEIEKSVAEKEKGAKGVGGSAPEDVDDAYDELLPSAIEVVVETGMASVSMLQRRLKLGYSRAARLVDQMEEKGVVGPFEGSKPRQVLISKEQWQEMQYKQSMVDVAPDAQYAEPVPEELEYEGDAIPQPKDMPPFDMGEEDF